MENHRVVNLFLEKYKTKRTEKIPGILTKAPREDQKNIYISDFGIPYCISDNSKSETKLLFVYLHDCPYICNNVVDKKGLKFFKLDCIELTRLHIEKIFLAENNLEQKQILITDYQKKLHKEYKKIGMDKILPFKLKNPMFIEKLLSKVSI